MKISFTPVICEHAARFVGRTPWQVSRDAKLMFEGHRRAYLEYPASLRHGHRLMSRTRRCIV